MSRMTYVQRRANRYEFRYRLPDDLAGRAAPASCPPALTPLVNGSTKRFKREIVKTLKTNDGSAANRRALSHIAEAHSLKRPGRRLRDASV